MSFFPKRKEDSSELAEALAELGRRLEKVESSIESAVARINSFIGATMKPYNSGQSDGRASEQIRNYFSGVLDNHLSQIRVQLAEALGKAQNPTGDPRSTTDLLSSLEQKLD